MLRRKIDDVLRKWKETPDHLPLIVKGCRQCGKTFSVMHFAKENQGSVRGTVLLASSSPVFFP